jgi:TATA-box binding protein (TBP) (component of TFIID and TFIIIB)
MASTTLNAPVSASVSASVSSSVAPSTKPTPYRISTITFNGDLNVYLRGPIFFKYAQVSSMEDQGFVWMECWFNGNQQTLGVFPKKKPVSKAKKPTPTATPADFADTPELEKENQKPKHKSFDNQISMYYRFRTGYIPHIKLFKNGNVHMTGLRTIEDGMFLLNVLHDEIARMFQIDPEVLQAPTDITALKITRPIVRLINSDFQVPFKIRRKELHQLLISPPYNTLCSFQPGTYPGVKLEYYWNIQHTPQDGCCRCVQPCFQKKTGVCKKVTVAVFDSGSILITGATSIQQVDDAYAFICNVIMTHIDYLKKNIPILEAKQ